MKKFIILCLSLFILSGCSKTSNETLIIGYTDFPPLGYKDKDGQAIGFDIDLANEIGKRLNKSIRFQYINWDTKTLELNSGNIDAIWNGFSITPERQKEVLFTKPYIDNAIVFLRRKGNTAIQSLDDLQGKAVAVETESSGQHALSASVDMSNLTLNRFTTISEALLDLKAGSSDVVVSDAIYANYILEQEADYDIIPNLSLSAEQYGIGLRKEDTALQTELNDALKALKEDGTISELSIQWFGQDLSL